MRSTPPRRPRQPASETRTSNQVGSPWMFEGKMLRGATGTPMRRIDLANRRFADAEPEPLTLANFTTKSLTRAIGETFIRRAPSLCRCRVGRTRTGNLRRAPVLVAGLRRLEEEFLHVPGTGRTTLG